MRAFILLVLLTACANAEDRLVWVPGHWAQSSTGENVWVPGEYVRQEVPTAPAAQPQWVEDRWVYDERLQTWTMAKGHWEAPVTQRVVDVSPTSYPPPAPRSGAVLGVGVVIGSGYSDYSSGCGSSYYRRPYYGSYYRGDSCNTGRAGHTTVVSVPLIPPPPTPKNIERVLHGKSPKW